MNLLRDHTFHVVLVAMQTTIIIGGILTTSAMLKAAGYPQEFRRWPEVSVFIRNWGFLFLFIPALWVGLMLWLEKQYFEWMSNRWVILSAVAIMLFLTVFFAVSSIRPMIPHIRHY